MRLNVHVQTHARMSRSPRDKGAEPGEPAWKQTSICRQVLMIQGRIGLTLRRSHGCFNSWMNAALMKCGAAYSCNQPALADYVLFFIIISDYIKKNEYILEGKELSCSPRAAHLSRNDRSVYVNIHSSHSKLNADFEP